MNESIQALFQPAFDWIALHPTWAGIAIFFISLSESLVVVGLVVPGVFMMTAIGIMIGNGVLPPVSSMIWAILGAIAGDGISYWVGYHYHSKLRGLWPFKNHPNWLARGERFFEKHGGKSIILGRFIGPVRPMIPVIAGMMDMPPRQFLLFNVLSAIAWAPIYTLPGILIGASLGTLTPEIASRVALIILVVLFSAWIAYSFILGLLRYLVRLGQTSIEMLWIRWQNVSFLPSLRNLLINKQLPSNATTGLPVGQLGIFFILLISAYALWRITESTLSNTGISTWNEYIYQALRALYWVKLIDICSKITNFSEPLIVLPIAALFGLFLFLRKQLFVGVCWLGTIGLGSGIGYLMKHFIPNPRPEGLIYRSTENSFPSGHALMATLFFGFLALLLRAQLPARYRWCAWSVALPVILILSFTRLYLGQHWFTDILGSWALAVFCLSLGWIVYRRFEPTPQPLAPWIFSTILLLCVFAGLYNVKYYHLHRPNLNREWQTSQFQIKDWWAGESLGMNLSHRQGAFRREATLFDVQWLGLLPNIEAELLKNGWVHIPKLSVTTALSALSKEPASDEFPIMPKYHRDRLPVLKMAKPLNKTHRLVLQLWQSDHEASTTGTPLWVGTIRHEATQTILPLITLYREVGVETPNALKNLYRDLHHKHTQDQLRFVHLPITDPEQTKEMLLIR
jgi:undecaprenyl-diphosphatase